MAKYTQKAIMTAFQQMLEEMPFDRITVSALVKRCEISSNTFYYHYHDIYELLNAWLHMAFDSYFGEGQELADAVKSLLRGCKKHSRIIYHVFDSLSRNQLEQYTFSMTDDIISALVRSYAAGRSVPDGALDELAGFCRYAFVGFFLKFLWERMESDIDKTVDSLARLLDRFLKSAVEDFPEND